MGDKARARRTVMQKAGVPILPGSDGPVECEDEALEFAKKIGYPVIVKATAGGGGRGMRVVRDERELSGSYETARAEAEAAFGVGDVYLEKYLESPRHIEFQILGDSSRHGRAPGRARVLDSAPPPEADRGSRRRRRSATRCCGADGRMRRLTPREAVPYTNAGTFEFLMDPDGRFYFMETNTRLQVEHPVTEMVTGIDIVKEQIRIAAGERLSFSRARSDLTGHSIECRINAEDPDDVRALAGPHPTFSVPGGPGVRVDTAASRTTSFPLTTTR